MTKQSIIKPEEIDALLFKLTGYNYRALRETPVGEVEEAAKVAAETAQQAGYELTENEVYHYLTGSRKIVLIACKEVDEPHHKNINDNPAHITIKRPEVDLPINKYAREIKPGVFVDVYDVLAAWGVECPAIQHAIKKQLQPGARGNKSRRQDIEEAIASLNRALELPFLN